MSKPKHPGSLAPNEAQAIASNLRTSPRKLNLVAAQIRNLPAGRALAELTFSKRRIAQAVRKTLESAIANAENNHGLDVDQLVVSRAEVGRSIVMRRFHARGRGRASRIEKWFSHLKIVVAEPREDSLAEPREDSVAEPREDSLAELRGDSLAELRGDSLAELRGDSLAELRGDGVAELRGEVLAPATDSGGHAEQGTA